jgi:RNA polymerase sigma factor (sigma-70 family)
MDQRRHCQGRVVPFRARATGPRRRGVRVRRRDTAAGVAARPPHRLSSRDRAEAYLRLRGPLLRAARRWFPSLGPDDLEDLHQSAWLSTMRTEAEIENLEAYLYEAIHSQGLMELRRRRRRPAESLERPDETGQSRAERADLEPVGVVGEAAPDEQVEARLLAGLVREVLAELTPRQQQVAKLRWGWGLSREEIAATLALSPRTVKRELRRASERLEAEGDVVREGRWCERRRSLITAYALGVLSENRAARARRHLDSCPGCRALVLEQRRRAEWLAALLPACWSAPPDTGRWDALVGALDEVRERAVELAIGAKQQLALASARASDPTPLAGARPGAVAFVVAGCVAAGGGTYCAVEGLPDLWQPPRPVGPHRADTRQRERATPTSRASQPAPEPPVETPAPASIEPPPPVEAPPPQPQPAPPPPPSEPPPAPPPEPPEFFDHTAEPAAAPPPEPAPQAQPAASPAGSSEFAP